MKRAVQTFQVDDLHVGLAARFERDVSEADVLVFAENSGDHNPLHVDALYAANTNYGRRIAHGAYQVGLASALIGVDLPGRDVLLSAIHGRFPAPLYFPTRVSVQGEITAWNKPNQSGRMHVIISDLGRHVPTAEIDLEFMLQSKPSYVDANVRSADPSERHENSSQKLVLVTGASGGIGEVLTRSLADHCRVLAQVNRSPLSESLLANPNVTEVALDFTSANWIADLTKALDSRSLYAIVHAAWPGPPQGSLLEMDPETIETQIRFGSTHLIKLARFLRNGVDSEGGRMIAIGSAFGTRNPVLSLGSYSLGKAVLEHTVRLLAPELARKMITINAVCPSLIPIGMNKTINERQFKLEIARTPLGRACSANDVAGIVNFLLSPAAGYVSGEILHLTGGRIAG